jgi:hypothetical protein
LFLLVLAIPGAGLAAAGAVLLTGHLTGAEKRKKHDDAQFLILLAAGAALVVVGVSCAVYRKTRANTAYAAWKAAEPAAAELFEAKGGYAAVKLVPQVSAPASNANIEGPAPPSFTRGRRNRRDRRTPPAAAHRAGEDRRRNGGEGGASGADALRQKQEGEGQLRMDVAMVPAVSGAKPSCSDTYVLSIFSSDTTDTDDDNHVATGPARGARDAVRPVPYRRAPRTPTRSAPSLMQRLLAGSGASSAAPCYGAMTTTPATI